MENKIGRGRPAKYPWYTMNVGETFTVPKKMITIPPKAFEDGKSYNMSRVKEGVLVKRVA